MRKADVCVSLQDSVALTYVVAQIVQIKKKQRKRKMTALILTVRNRNRNRNSPYSVLYSFLFHTFNKSHFYGSSLLFSFVDG